MLAENVALLNLNLLLPTLLKDNKTLNVVELSAQDPETGPVTVDL